MRFLRENLGYKVLALALSIALWANVKLRQEPFTTALPLPLQVRNVPEQMVAVPSATQVSVVLYGPRVYVSNLDADKLKAYVNLGDTSPGHHREDVSVEVPGNIKPLVSIQAVTPNQIDVRLFQKVQRTVPVRVDWSGEPLAGTRYGSVQLDPRVADVAGAEHVVSLVDHVAVTVEAGDPHIVGRFRPVAVDDEGDPVSDVMVTPEYITVDATLTQTEGRRQAFVSPVYRGKPAAGFGIDQVWTQPQVVTLLGPPEVIDSISSVPTESIDITGKQGDVVENVPLQVPSGVRTVPETVQVRIRLQKGASPPG